MLDYIRALWQGNPVRCAAIAAAAIVSIAAKAGVILDEASVLELVTAAGTIILGGELARSQVSPARGDVGTPSDELLKAELANGS